MTKLNSKKMSKSTFAIIIMAIAMVAMLAFGGTYAYFTASANSQEATGVTTATVAIATGAANSQIVTQNIKKNVLPGETAIAATTIAVTSTSTVETYIFATVSTSGSAEGLVVKLADGKTAPIVAVDYSALTGAGWERVEEITDKIVFVYNAAAKTTDDVTANFIFSAKFNENVQSKNVEGAGETTNVYAANDTTFAEDKSVMGLTFGVKVEFAAIQKVGADGTGTYTVEDAYAALTTQGL